ncbi:AraC family transcriptional regulator [Rhodoblastus sp.]|uniref:AraC family transcriptional regulator n=1 Tax=Rhodoblastus sp. TaxID=1962975 RepID=UPI003F9AA2F6
MIRARWDQKIYPPVKIARVADALAAEGVPLSDALQGTQLTEQQLRSPNVLVSVNQVIVSYRNAMRLTRNPDFAFRTGLKSHVAAYGMYGFAILSSTNFRETMKFVVKYHHLATPVVRLRFEETQTHGVWVIDPLPHPAIDRSLYRFIVEMQFATHIALHRDIMGSAFAPSELQMTFCGHESNAPFEQTLGCPCRRRQPENRLMFDAAWLNAEPRCGNEIAYASVIGLCDELEEELAQRVGVAEQVRQTLLASIGRRTDFSEIARQLGVPARTLRRKLKEQETSFGELIGELKSHLAIKYLRDTQMTVEDIAGALGFSDAANFRQSFRRWTKTTPQDFRRMIVS